MKDFTPLSFDALGAFAAMWMTITRIPLPHALRPQTLVLPSADAMVTMPLAGALFALLAVLPAWALTFVLPPEPCAWLACAIYTALGWSFHIDGWGDLWDGLGSGRRGEAMRTVMKDSRTGSFGVAGIVLALALRAVLLASIPSGRWLAACMLAGGVGRFGACVTAFAGIYPWPGGLGKEIVDGTDARRLACAFLLSCLLIPFAPAAWSFGVLLAALGGLILARTAGRTLGGTNGDVLGAAAVLGELSVLLAIAATLHL